VISGVEFVGVSLLVGEGIPLIHSNDLFLCFSQLRKLIRKSRGRFLYIDLESKSSLDFNSLFE
jgi:hypothetical protein